MVANVIAWNARSQAAYHGYSHLSGIEMMSSLIMWNHSLLRIVLAERRERPGVVLLEPFGDIEAEVLFAPEHSGERLAHDVRGVFAGSAVGAMSR